MDVSYAREERRFNLCDEPWIPVFKHDGTQAELSLSELFVRWETIDRLACELPTVDIAVQRVLQAIVARAINTHGHDITTEQWHQGPQFIVPAIHAYLDEHHDEFWLFDPVRPFFQTPIASTRNDDIRATPKLWDEHRVTRLLPEFENTPYRRRTLSSRLDSEIDSLTFAEAARWLIAAQSFDKVARSALHHESPAGLREHLKPTHLTRGTIVAATGTSLAETLWLNMPDTLDLPRFRNDSPANVPAWEKIQHGGPDSLIDFTDKELSARIYAEDAGTRRVGGPIDLWTWQSRRISLITDGDVVVACTKTQGDIASVADVFAHETMVGWLSLGDESDRFGWVISRLPHGAKAWSGSTALLARPQKNSHKPPAGALWASRHGGALFSGCETVWADRKSRYADIVEHRLMIPPELNAMGTTALNAVDGFVTDAVNLIETHAKAAMSLGFDEDSLSTRMYGAVEPLWYDFLTDIASGHSAGATGRGRRSRKNLYEPSRDTWLNRISKVITPLSENTLNRAARAHGLPRSGQPTLGEVESVLRHRVHDITGHAPHNASATTGRAYHHVNWRGFGHSIPPHIPDKPFSEALNHLGDIRGIAVFRRAQHVAAARGDETRYSHLRGLLKMMTDAGIGFDHQSLDDDLGRIAAGGGTEVLRDWGAVVFRSPELPVVTLENG